MSPAFIRPPRPTPAANVGSTPTPLSDPPNRDRVCRKERIDALGPEIIHSDLPSGRIDVLEQNLKSALLPKLKIRVVCVLHPW